MYESFTERPLEELDLCMRTYSRLKSSGVTTVEKLTSMSQSELAKIKGIGGVYMEGFLEEMAQNGIELRP